jgi:hypothetical protein
VARLVEVCTDLEIDAIIPTSEEVFWLAGAAQRLPSRVQLRTSALPVLAELHHKGSFANLASSLGYGVPENWEIRSGSELAKIGDPTRFVLKPVYSRFASRALVGPQRRDLARLRPSVIAPWLVQTRVIGRELCAYNIAHRGRLLLHVAYEPLFRKRVGASLYFLPVENEPLRRMSERIVQATGFTGQISFDAMETPTGMVALECNPRGTSGVHLAAQRPAEFVQALLGTLRDPCTVDRSTPKMLLLPLLLNHPNAWFGAQKRRMLQAADDALSGAGISLWAQAQAVAEMAWLAARLRVSIPTASTADIEWNGEAFDV